MDAAALIAQSVLCDRLCGGADEWSIRAGSPVELWRRMPEDESMVPVIERAQSGAGVLGKLLRLIEQILIEAPGQHEIGGQNPYGFACLVVNGRGDR